MPVIQPERLKQQAAELAQNFLDCDQFARSLDNLLNLYAERAVRPSQSGEPSPLLDKYGVPPPVLRYILLAVSPYVQAHPGAALALCDRLWQEPILEFRNLAIGILGKIPSNQAGQVVARVKNWAEQESERRLRSSLFEAGFSGVRKNNSELILTLAQDWLLDPGLDKQKLGLMALLSLASDLEFENLPIFFKFLTPIAINIQSELRPELLDIMLVLARRSPPETAYFIQELLLIPGCQTAGWLARQLMPHFPEVVAETVRQALYAASNQPTRPLPPYN